MMTLFSVDREWLKALDEQAVRGEPFDANQAQDIFEKLLEAEEYIRVLEEHLQFDPGGSDRMQAPAQARGGALAQEVCAEVERARGLHAQMHSAHEGYAVLKEEVDELWDEIKKKVPDKAATRKEALQVAAMGLRFVLDVIGE